MVFGVGARSVPDEPIRARAERARAARDAGPRAARVPSCSGMQVRSSTARLSRKVLARWNWPKSLAVLVKQHQQVDARVWVPVDM